jgi:hypothetical protein
LKTVELTSDYMTYLIVVNSTREFRSFLPSVWLTLFATLFLCAHSPGQKGPSSGPPGIQDNSFLVEEAYNQNFGVVQHISSFTRFWDSKDWNYTFTQEWPVPGDARHQLSYTLAAAHAGAFPGSGAGIGDVFLNYRYQLVGSGDTRVAFSPRLSLFSYWRFHSGSRRRKFRSANQSSTERRYQQEAGQPHVFPPCAGRLG